MTMTSTCASGVRQSSIVIAAAIAIVARRASGARFRAIPRSAYATASLMDDTNF